MPKQPKEIVIVGSKVKAIVSGDGMRSDGELVQAISDRVHEMVEAAKARAKENGRNTVRPHDL
jgi:chorismate mutase